MFPLVLLQVKAVGAENVQKKLNEALTFPLVLLQVKAVGPPWGYPGGGCAKFPLVLLQVKAVGWWAEFCVGKTRSFH